MKKIFCADLFCGGGGTSTGMINAFRRAGIEDKDIHLIGVNHWNIAIETNKINHPFEKLYCSTVENVKPREAVPSGRLNFLWASPECTNHSRAKGGRPLDKQSRATAWDILKWVQELYIDRIYIENVEEFLEWGPLDRKGRPIKSKKGNTFRAFVSALESFGYRIGWQIMNAADFGAPTDRKRLIIQAVRGRGKIIWPDPTHAREPGIFGEKPWRAAAEIIDWSIPGKSIFGRKKPLCPNTLRRIEAGIRKYWGQWAEPFLIVLRGTGEKQIDASAIPLSAPVPTITTTGKHVALITPIWLDQSHTKTGGVSGRITDPLNTICCSHGTHSVVTPVIMDMSHPGDHADAARCRGGSDPMGTITCRNNWGVAMPLFIPQQSSGTVKPTEKNPLPTIATGGAIGLLQPFMFEYYGNGRVLPVDQPIPVIPTHDRFGLIQGRILTLPDGRKFKLDITHRMLTSRELAAATGFPSDYKFAGTDTDTKKQIGNAVSPNLSEALIYSALSA
ncbi:MAG: DNA cytosine methyltransferase [Lentisphaeria bacterium]|nr:DNA cytosine methyltransferase [Lentisphaeria bacterium]